MVYFRILCYDTSTEEKKLEVLNMIALQWQAQVLSLLDQSKYPAEEVWLDCDTVEAVAKAISSPVVQDEKIAAIAAAYGYCLAALANQDKQQTPAFDRALEDAKAMLLASRPGSRDVARAIHFLENPPEAYTKNVDRLTTLMATAVTFDRQQVVADRNICRNGTDIMSPGTRVMLRTDKGLFHSASPAGVCGIVRRGYKRKFIEQIVICEGRPTQEAGNRIARELTVKEEVPVVVIPDHAAASCLARQGANVVMTDGILAAKNGDLKAPVGSYELAIACYFHSIPFYAVMNADDIDLDIPSGDAFGRDVLPEDLATPGLDCGTAERWCPAFDVVPAFLITGYLTDRGIASAPYEETLDNLVKHAPKKLILNFDA